MNQPYQVYFVDDNSTEQKLFSLLVRIKNLPLEVVGFPTAVSALKALEALKDEDFPNVIITDIKMPLMDGFEFADVFLEKFKRKHPDLIFAISSSTIRTDDIERANDHPVVSSFIEKPFNEEKIRHHILGKLATKS